MEHFLIILGILLLLLQPVTYSSNISCSAGVATFGNQAKITCNFNRDIESSKQNFVIWRYPLHTMDLDNSTDKTDVLSCNWLEQGDLNCRTTEGYEYKKQSVTTTVSVDIPTATEDQVGIYKCQLQIQEIIPTSTCNLTVRAREENQPINNFFTALTLNGAFVLIVVLIVGYVILIIAFIIYWCQRKSNKTVENKIASADRGTDTLDLKQSVVDFGVDTEDLAAFVAASKGKFSLFSRKDEKKTTSKQTTQKRSQENLVEENEEEKPLLPATAPPQYVPPTQVTDPKADHSPDDGQPTQEAAGGPSDAAAEVGDFVAVEIPTDSDVPVETDQDTALNENGKSKGKDKKRSRFSLSKKK